MSRRNAVAQSGGDKVTAVDLPRGWISVPLGEMGFWVGGGTPNKAIRRYWTNGTIPWVSPKDVKDEILTDSEDHITPEGLADSNTNMVAARSVLVVVRSGILRHRLPVAVTTLPVSINQDIRALELPHDLEPNYVAWALENYATDILRTCSKAGTTVSNIEFKRFMAYRIPVAPTSEQHRIVAELQKQFRRLETAILSLERAQVGIQRARGSLLKAACSGQLVPIEAKIARQEQRSFETGSELISKIIREHELAATSNDGRGSDAKAGSPHDLPTKDRGTNGLPKGWAWATAERLVPPGRVITYGVVQPGPSVDKGIPLVRVGDINEGYVNESKLKRIASRIAARYSRTKLQGGEIVITLVGAIGRTAVIPATLAGANVARAVGVIPITPLIDARWAEIWLRNPETIALMTSKSHETARKTLNLEDVRSAPIAIPPLAEQRRIIVELKRQTALLESLESVIVANRKRAGRLRESLLRQAFNGQLVAQSTYNESAHDFVAQTREWKIKHMKARARSKVKPPNNGTRKQEASSHSLLAILLQNPDGLSPEALFAEAGYRQNEATDVYAFYRELRLLKTRLRQESSKPTEYRNWASKPIVLLKLLKKG